MSDIMYPISFPSLLDWIFEENKNGSVFGCKKYFKANTEKTIPVFGGKVETPFGPAAGPHTQLAQNIVSGYVAGARFFELKTVQILEGENMIVNKPCIYAEDEAYNCEWSTELLIKDALAEYIKAWFAVKVVAKEFQLGGIDGFVFNMSVGYDLKGIKGETVNSFIEGMKDASNTETFKQCKEELYKRLPSFKYLTKGDIDGISPHICNNITLSTMHGCPADEIERITSYLIEEKGLNTYLKCNPTLIGYDRVRSTLDELGYGYIKFDDKQFTADLQFEDAVPMFNRLTDRANAKGVVFGVKLTNTFPVMVTNNELPDKMMYMSGKALLPLTLGVAEKLAVAFDGKLPMSYSGGADSLNIESIYETGIFPITVCTDLLKPGGYHRIFTMANKLSEHSYERHEIDSEKINELLCETVGSDRYKKLKPFSIKRKPLSECNDYSLPCKNVCGCCVTLCPNRANAVIETKSGTRMIHIDGLCNECGNCASFCLEGRAPYLEKITLFTSVEAMKDSKNNGFAPNGNNEFTVRIDGKYSEYCDGHCTEEIPTEVIEVIDAVKDNYSYLMYR